MFRLAAVALTLCLATITAQGALLGRAALTPGGTDYQAYYDDALNITWLADANLALTNNFGVSGICTTAPQCTSNLCPGSDPQCTGEPGVMTWYVAQDWLSAMNTANYLGATNWRLPNMDVNGDHVIQSSCGIPDRFLRDNQLAYMKCRNGVAGGSFSAPFSNVGRSDFYFGFIPSEYASSTVDPVDDHVWYFPFGGPPVSGTTRALKSELMYVWAVRPGDIGVVPVPAAALLFGSALGLMGVMRRKVTEKPDG